MRSQLGELQEAYEQAAGERDDLRRLLAEAKAGEDLAWTERDTARDLQRTAEAELDAERDRHAETRVALEDARRMIVALYHGTADGASPEVDREARRTCRSRALRWLMADEKEAA